MARERTAARSRDAGPREAAPGEGLLLKRILVGRPHPTSRLEHTRLPKFLALPIFSSDPLSSVAYATEQIMVVLLATSAASRHLAMPISVAIAVVLAVVVASYRQTVRAYPSGGGAYVVSKDNLGTGPALVAAAALLVDYVLTVSVSVVAGVVAVVGAVPSLGHLTVEIAIGFVVLLTLANLRGVRESGMLFALPTYAFVAAILVMLAVGVTRCAVSGCPTAATQHVTAVSGLARTAAPLGLFVILHAFSSGATALTGVEAISNGVQAFKRPQARNAATTLAVMGAIAITMFLGISYLSTHVSGVVPPATGERSVVGQVAFAVFGGGAGFYVVQVVTAAILVLAANTSFQGFPQLSAILAIDRYMPRQFANRGNRLVYSNGVLILAVLAAALIWAFHGNLDRLIQLYVVGVFTSFTLSQAGMVRHWTKARRQGGPAARGWRRSILINAVGAVCTAVVLVIITATKIREGAWLSILAMGVFILFFTWVHRHYRAVAAQLRQGRVEPATPPPANQVVLFVERLDVATAKALGYVRAARGEDFRAVHVRSGQGPVDIAAGWSWFSRSPNPLEIVETEGDRVGAFIELTRSIPRGPGEFLTVVVPEQLSERSLLAAVRGRDTFALKLRLLKERRIAVTDVPVLVESGKSGRWHGGHGANPGSNGGGVVDPRPLTPKRLVTLVLISGVHDPTIRAVNYATSLRAMDTRAVYFALDPKETAGLVEQWLDRGLRVRLDIADSPLRDLGASVLREIRTYTRDPDTVVSVVMPELVVSRRYHQLLHNQRALFLKRLLLFEPRVVLTSVPYRLREVRQPSPADPGGTAAAPAALG
jgi:amino acid transporter